MAKTVDSKAAVAARTAAAKLLGSAGGKASAAKLTAEQRQERGRKALNTMVDRAIAAREEGKKP